MLSFSPDAQWHQPLPTILYSRLFQGIDLEKLEFSCFPASSVDTDLAPGNYFTVPLETFSMESVFCPAAPWKCFEMHCSMAECSLDSVSSGEILSSVL